MDDANRFPVIRGEIGHSGTQRERFPVPAARPRHEDPAIANMKAARVDPDGLKALADSPHRNRPVSSSDRPANITNFGFNGGSGSLVPRPETHTFYDEQGQLID